MTNSISMYAASVPVFKQLLVALNDNLKKAAAHAHERRIDPHALPDARLFPDMFPLTKQVQVAADFAKGVSARLAGIDVPKHEDNEQTLEELQARITKTIAFLDTLRPEQINGSEARPIVASAGKAKERHFDGLTYLLHYGLPHFYFHVTTAYNLLRHNGVEVGKEDYMGRSSAQDRR